jgi:hypothetical protein
MRLEPPRCRDKEEPEIWRSVTSYWAWAVDWRRRSEREKAVEREIIGMVELLFGNRWAIGKAEGG